MFKNMKLGTKLISGFIVVSSVIIVVGIIQFFFLKKLTNEAREMTEASTLIDAAMEMKISVTKTQQLIMELLAAQDANELEEFWKEQEHAVEEFDLFCDAILNGAKTEDGEIFASQNKKLRNLAERADGFHNDKLQPPIRNLYEIRKGNSSSDLQSEMALLHSLDEEADGVAEKMLGLLTDIEEVAKAEITEAQGHFAHAVKSSITSLAISIIVGFMVAIFLGVFITRSITGPVNRVIETIGSGSEQVSSASIQLSSSSQELAQGSSEQASSLEEISSNVEELTSMTKQNADNSRQANEMGSSAKKAGDESQAAVNKMSATVEGIKKASDETAQIIKTIDEIAMQTNLLALNAAVEAARAGDAGRGFAVVAEEVRNLAQRSAEAAKNTAALIEGMQKSSEDGVSAASVVEKTIDEITSTISKMTGLLNEVSAASGEQSGGLEQINSAITQLDQVTQRNAANSEETASASEEMSAQSEGLKSAVGDLKNIVGSSKNRGKQIEFQKKSTLVKQSYHQKHNLNVPNELSVIDRRKHEVTPEELIPFNDNKELEEF